jgi:hypothetical protein
MRTTVVAETYRFTVGSIECIAVSDGTFTYPLWKGSAAHVRINSCSAALSISSTLADAPGMCS